MIANVMEYKGYKVSMEFDAEDKIIVGRLMLRVDPKVHAAAIKKAAKSGVSLNKWAEGIFKAATAQ